MMKQMTLKCPLFAAWSEQHVRLHVAGVKPGTPLRLTINGQPAAFQYTGAESAAGAEILLKLGFAEGETKELEFGTQDTGHRTQEETRQNLERYEMPLDHDVLIGLPGRELLIPAPLHPQPSTLNLPPSTAFAVSGPFAAFADSAMSSAIHCETAFEGASLARTNDGPLFTDYELQYRFAEDRRYTLTFRCYKLDPYIEVSETFSLRMNAELVWTLNPAKRFTHILSRDSFEGESQPTVEPLGTEHPRDVLCRLQMPVLTEYFIPNNRGWFAFFDERDEARGMVGILGLYGAKWEEPVANMPELLDKGGTVEWHSSLASGKRHWLLYAGPVEKGVRCQVSGVRKPEEGGRVQGSGFGKKEAGHRTQDSGLRGRGTGSEIQDGGCGKQKVEGGRWKVEGRVQTPSAASRKTTKPDRLKPGHQPVGAHASACPAVTPSTPDPRPSNPGPITGHRSPITDHRFIFHRLHAEFNALRLDEHLDLTGEGVYDASCATAPGVFAAGDCHAAAQQRLERYPCLQTVLDAPDGWMRQNGGMHLTTYRYLLTPTPENAQALYGHLLARFEKWVCQFQGYRTGESDYMKNVIGFSRYLRGMLLGYELLRRDGVLTDDQVRRLNVYFAFAARRILDEGRWPHSRTMLHPDHPESSRDFYTYGGEHKPDRLAWTNCLPNFQSDPMCALAHLSAIFKEHPDARHWQRFALDDIDRQLDAYCGKSGAWEESINYALYTLSYFVITFKAVKERWGMDYFNDDRVRRFVGWLCRFFGPYDKRFDAYTWPAIGNAVLPQNQAECLLCYAGELADGDPLKKDCLTIWQLCAEKCRPGEHYPVVMAAMAPFEISNFKSEISELASEVMDEVGVAMRDRHTRPDESYLFQKIGFAKDHYEADETAFNWYAKGTPLCMDYGTYTGDVAVAGAHNVIEIPDEDNLRRGYLADHLFTSVLDYTRCEVPVTLKLLWGKVRSFAEVENKDGKIDRTKTPYFYIGDKNPVGPKCWKVRQLFFVKPDYLVLFDRVYGQVPHRFNLHVTAESDECSVFSVQCSGDDSNRSPVTDHRLPITGHRSLMTDHGAQITAAGRFDLDLLAFVQHPRQFEMETGEIVPNVHPGCGGEDARKNHAQHYFRLYNRQDGIYRTLLFARERGREVCIEALGEHGVKVVTPEYTDYVFLHNEPVVAKSATDGVAFAGRCGWIRRDSAGRIQAVVPDGDRIAAFGVQLDGRGPWTYNLDGTGKIDLRDGAPRQVRVSTVSP